MLRFSSVLFATLLLAAPAATAPVETPSLAAQVAAGTLPPVAERLPDEPLVVDLEAKGRTVGKHGGTLRSLISKSKNIRYMTVWGYARLVGHDHNLELKPDLLHDIEVEEGRIFTLHLREGHKWSDGHPFTTEDFRYWWEDVANNAELSPTGPPRIMLAGGQSPEVTLISETEIRYEWAVEHPEFLPALAQARPPFIYAPAHYLKDYHKKYADMQSLQYTIEAKKVRNWAQLHNRVDNMYKNDNSDLPTLQPWINTTGKKGQRFINTRNPYFHRVDTAGQQLPYIDTVELTVSASSLFPAKANAGEVDLLGTGLGFMSVPILKQGERKNPYETRLWPTGSGSHIALYPNLNYNDPAWRGLLRDARFRRALSFGIDRDIINRTLYFGLATACANSALPESPLYSHQCAFSAAEFFPEAANELLDEIGLTERRGDGIRLLPDGRPLEIIVESTGERIEEIDALQLVGETWRELGIKLIVRPTDRDIVRNRTYAGRSMMTVWKGWDNGLPTPETPPEELAPVRQDTWAWPKWGQYHETMGASGEPPDMPAGRRLMELYTAWKTGTLPDGSKASRTEIWREMINIHARELFVIGVVSSAPQPIVVSNRLRNVPEEGLFSWAPGAQFGVHRIDEFYFAPADQETAALK